MDKVGAINNMVLGVTQSKQSVETPMELFEQMLDSFIVGDGSIETLEDNSRVDVENHLGEEIELEAVAMDNSPHMDNTLQPGDVSESSSLNTTIDDEQSAGMEIDEEKSGRYSLHYNQDTKGTLRPSISEPGLLQHYQRQQSDNVDETVIQLVSGSQGIRLNIKSDLDAGIKEKNDLIENDPEIKNTISIEGMEFNDVNIDIEDIAYAFAKGKYNNGKAGVDNIGYSKAENVDIAEEGALSLQNFDISLGSDDIDLDNDSQGRSPHISHESTSLKAAKHDSADSAHAIHKQEQLGSGLKPVDEQISVHVSRAVKNKYNKMTVELEPKDLGHVEIHLEFSKDAPTKVQVLAEKYTTFELLSRHTAGFEEALTSENPEGEGAVLDFAMKQESGDGSKKHNTYHASHTEDFNEEEIANKIFQVNFELTNEINLLV